MARPKSTTPNKEAVTFRIEPDKLSKIRYIAWFQRDNVIDVVDNAFDSEIAKFEKKNGAITETQIKQALKK